jgi:hypothetical protein
MYARVASFEGRDPSLTDELIERVRERGPGAVAAARGFLGLFDREHGTALGITFFDSEEAIRDSEQAFEEMAQHFPTEMRGRRTSVETYEVTIQEGGEGAKAARVSSHERSPTASMRASAGRARRRFRKRASCPGWKGVLGLADRESGRVKLITLWESADVLRASEEQADRLRTQAAESGGQRVTGVSVTRSRSRTA